MVPGAVIWFGLLQAGIHPSVGGVVVGLLTPAVANSAPRPGDDLRPPVVWLQERLHGWSTFLVMPVFALANAGVNIAGNPLGDKLALDIFTGVVLGLVLGKPLGILAASWLAERLGLITLPAGVGWGGIAVIGALAGIGFTMSIFIGSLAFEEGVLLDSMKLGVLGGSLVSAEQEFMLLPGEKTEMVMCRMRSLGCSPCTGAIRSEADTIDKIIDEMKLVRRSERENRVIDHDQEGSMEIKKREGYF